MLTEGEAWVRAELTELRDAGYGPAATARFLWRCQQRAGRVRRDRPELARREAGWLAAGAGAYVGSGHAGAVRWWLLVGLMLDWHLGMLETEDGIPRNLGTADALTLSRAWLVPLVLAAPSPALVVVGFTTDVLDGVAARATAPTRAGRDLEALVDAAFAAAVLVGTRRRRQLGRAAVAAELSRTGAGIGYAVASYFGRAQPPDRAALGAARGTTAVRGAGMLAATLGRRRAADALLVSGSVLSVALLARHAH